MLTPRPRPTTTRPGFGPIELLVVVAIIAILIGLMLPAVQKVREAANRAKYTNNLKQEALACLNFESTFGNYPPAAVCDDREAPLLSWRVSILPYLEQNALYQKFAQAEAWDSATNKPRLINLPIYAPVTGDGEPTSTHDQFFVGKDTMHPKPNDKPTIGQILDGTSNTVLIAEARAAVPWSKPADLPYAADKPLPDLGYLMPLRGFQVALCDGSVRVVAATVSEKTLRNAITPADGNPPGNDW